MKRVFLFVIVVMLFLPLTLAVMAQDEGSGAPPSQLTPAMGTAIVAYLLTPYLIYGLKKWAPNLLEDQGLPTNATLTLLIHVASWGIFTGLDVSRWWEWLGAFFVAFVGSSGAVRVGQQQTSQGMSRLKPPRS